VAKKRPAAPEPVGKLLYKIGEAAHVLSTGKTKVYELIARGELPAVHLPARYPGGRQDTRVTRADLEALIQKLRSAS